MSHSVSKESQLTRQTTVAPSDASSLGEASSGEDEAFHSIVTAEFGGSPLHGSTEELPDVMDSSVRSGWKMTRRFNVVTNYVRRSRTRDNEGRDGDDEGNENPGRPLERTDSMFLQRTSFFEDYQPRDYVDIPIVTPDVLAHPCYQKHYRSLMDNPWKMTVVPSAGTVEGQSRFRLVEFYSPNKLYTSRGNAHRDPLCCSHQLTATLPAHGSHANVDLQTDMFPTKMSYNLFCLKVFALLWAQVVFATTITRIALWRYDDFFARNAFLVPVSSGIFFVFFTLGIVFRRWKRKFPCNMFLLLTLILSSTLLACVISAFLRSTAIFVAALGVAFGTTALVLISVQFVLRVRFPADFFVILIIFGAIVGAWTGWSFGFPNYPSFWSLDEITIGLVTALFILLYWTWNVDMVMQGYKYEITKGDAIYVALNLYYDWLFAVIAMCEALILWTVGRKVVPAPLPSEDPWIDDNPMSEVSPVARQAAARNNTRRSEKEEGTGSKIPRFLQRFISRRRPGAQEQRTDEVYEMHREPYP